MIKQRKDSHQQFVAQNRADLAEVEEAQMKVIEKFLPAQLSSEELEAEIKKIITEVGAESLKDLGQSNGYSIQSFKLENLMENLSPKWLKNYYHS